MTRRSLFFCLTILITLTAQVAAQTPDSLVRVSLSADQTAVMSYDRDAIVMVEVSGADMPAGLHANVSMAVVIDTSGSMEGEKIEHARAAAHELVGRLSEGDRITIVTYDTRVHTVLDDFAIVADRSVAHEAIDDIETGGDTCVSCGLEAGYEALGEAPNGLIRHLILLSDGRANTGLEEPDALQALAEENSQTRELTTSTIGIGDDFNEAIMEGVALGGSGTYYFLPDSTALADILNRELIALSRTIATDVVVVLSPMDGATLSAEMASGARHDGSELIIEVGSLAAGEVRQYIVPMALPVGTLGEVATVTTVFRNTAGDFSEVTGSLEIARTESLADSSASNDATVLAQEARVTATADVEDAMSALEAGEYEAAEQQLRAGASRLREQAAATGSPILLDEAEALEELASEIDEDLDEERAHRLYLQNAARNEEVRRGVEPEEMYHDEMVTE